MRKTIEELLQEALNIQLVEMANLDQRHTGFTNQNLIMYVSTKQGSHGPRVKVFKKGYPDDTISFSIEKDPKMFTSSKSKLKLSRKDVQEIKYWIYKNYVVLLDLWNSKAKNVLIADFLNSVDKI